MKYFALQIIALCAVLAVPAHAQKGGVAILDFDELGRAMKEDQALMIELRQMEKDLNLQLNLQKQNMDSQMSNAKVQAGTDPTPEVQKQLLDFGRKLNAQFNDLRNKANRQLTARRVTRVNDFRKKMEPIIRESAKAAGLDVVLARTPQVLLFAGEVDITKDVIERAKAAGFESKVEIQMPTENAAKPAVAPAKKEEPKPAPAPVAKPKAAPAPAPAPAGEKKAEKSK